MVVDERVVVGSGIVDESTGATDDAADDVSAELGVSTGDEIVAAVGAVDSAEDATGTTEVDSTTEGVELAADTEDDAAEKEELTKLLPVGTSPARTQPVLAVRAAGQVTCSNETEGLSAFSKKSNLQ